MLIYELLRYVSTKCMCSRRGLFGRPSDLSRSCTLGLRRSSHEARLALGAARPAPVGHGPPRRPTRERVIARGMEVTRARALTASLLLVAAHSASIGVGNLDESDSFAWQHHADAKALGSVESSSAGRRNGERSEGGGLRGGVVHTDHGDGLMSYTTTLGANMDAGTDTDTGTGSGVLSDMGGRRLSGTSYVSSFER